MDRFMCMNLMCHSTETHVWMTGWPLKNGAFARLCYTCGSAYESSVFCETFHKGEAGWRNCRICAESIHCGCIASKHMYDYLDLGGVWCKNCQNGDAELRSLMSSGGTDNRSLTTGSSTNRSQPSDTALDKVKIVGSQVPAFHYPQTERNTTSYAIGQHVLNSDNTALVNGIVYPQTQMSNTSSPIRQITREENAQFVGQPQSLYDQIMTSTPIGSHLLVKHMPKVSKAEWQQIFEALNANVIPLFQKVLSASDASRVGRLVLPKICAEAYFPHLTESSGLTINLLDSNGKDWNFQLRFWNNISGRMYVFEGVQEYIRETGLEAQDAVMFGLLQPNKLVVGFKKINREELAITRRQAQDLLQPNPKSRRTIFVVEGYELEVYDKPPVIGNKAEFNTPVPRPSSSPERVLNERECPQSPDPKKPKVTEDESNEDQTSMS